MILKLHNTNTQRQTMYVLCTYHTLWNYIGSGFQRLWGTQNYRRTETGFPRSLRALKYGVANFRVNIRCCNVVLLCPRQWWPIFRVSVLRTITIAPKYASVYKVRIRTSVEVLLYCSDDWYGIHCCELYGQLIPFLYVLKHLQCFRVRNMRQYTDARKTGCKITR